MELVPGLDLDAPPFDRLDAASRERLQGAVDLGFFPAGSPLIEAGQGSESAYVVLRGRVEACADGEHAAAVGEFGPGTILGTHAVLHGRARHRYRAREDTVCFLIPAGVFQRLMADNPEFARLMR